MQTSSDLKGTLIVRQGDKRSGKYVNVVLTEDVIACITTGSGELMRWAMVEYVNEKGETVKYPFNLLYRTSTERCLNVAVRNLENPTLETVELMRSRVEELLGCDIEWVYNNSKLKETLADLWEGVDEQDPSKLLEILGYHISTLQRLNPTIQRKEYDDHWDFAVELLYQICSRLKLDGDELLDQLEQDEDEWLNNLGVN